MTKLYRAGLYCRLSVDDTHNSAKATNLIPADESRQKPIWTTASAEAISSGPDFWKC